MTNIYFESILMAFDSIFSNKMRSLLTMLGIIIGVAAVIALMSLGYGVRADIEIISQVLVPIRLLLFRERQESLGSDLQPVLCKV